MVRIALGEFAGASPRRKMRFVPRHGLVHHLTEGLAPMHDCHPQLDGSSDHRSGGAIWLLVKAKV